jgi:hypothetical protein
VLSSGSVSQSPVQTLRRWMLPQAGEGGLLRMGRWVAGE